MKIRDSFCCKQDDAIIVERETNSLPNQGKAKKTLVKEGRKVKSFVDNNRKNYQKNLSAWQRDQIYLSLTRENVEAKQKMVLKAAENSAKFTN